MASIAADGDRGISLNDFLTIMAKREADTALHDKLMKAFAVFDRDGSGFVSVDELRTQMMALGNNPFTESEFDQFMSEYIAEAPTSQTIGHPADSDGLMDYQ